MILQLPANPDGFRARVEIEGEGVYQTMTVSSEIKQIKKQFAEDVNEDNLAANLQFINNGGQPVGNLIVLKAAADSPPPLYDEPEQTKLDKEVEEANKFHPVESYPVEAIRVEDQDADMGPELKLESTNEEVVLEDREEDGVEADESVGDEPDPVMDEEVDEDEDWDDEDEDD